MIQAKCIEKFRDKTGKIYGYRLIDLNGNTQDVRPDNLKVAIRNKQIHVVNLTLTSDNRLMDTTEKQLQSKALGEAPVAPVAPVEKLDETYKEVAKALAYLDKETLDMGDDPVDCVYGRYYQAFGKDINITQHTNLDEIWYKSFLKMASDKPVEIARILGCWNEYEQYDTFERNIKYENVSSINKSKIYKALSLVYKYAKEKKLEKTVVKPLYDFLNKIKTTGIASINMGYQVGNLYYRYLDGSVFGTISNDVFTVGHTITASDIKEHKEYRGYNYVFHKDINMCGAPKISIAALFKNASDGNVQVDIKIERHGYKTPTRSCVGIAGYILDVCTLTLSSKSMMENSAIIIANRFNELAPKLYDLADVHQSLYSSLGYGLPLEAVSLDDLESHGRLTGKELVNRTVSRWTKIRGDKTPAKELKSINENPTNFRTLYSNNISQSGSDKKLFIEYDGSNFTLKVINNTDINDVIIEENAKMEGSILDNSPLISEVIAKALIKADVKRI